MAVSRSAKREPGRYRRQWRFYRSSGGREPVREFLDEVSDEDAAAIAAAMKQVRDIGRGHVDVNHLRGEIWQIEIDGKRVIYRLLFAEQGRFSQVLLALEIVTKKWQSAKSRHIQLASGVSRIGACEAVAARSWFSQNRIPRADVALSL